jgi:arylsulfatase A-like enzyme
VVRDCAIAGEQRPALLLPAGATAALDLSLSGRPASLELGLGVPEESRPGSGVTPVTLHVEVVDSRGARAEAGRALAPGRERDQSLWQDLVLDLASLAAGPATIRFSVTAPQDADAVGAFAAPVLVRREIDSRPPVILISLDTLRADRIGHVGERVLAPRMLALAQNSVWFRQAYASAPFTLPSHATMFSGQMPSVHGAEHPGTGLDPHRSAVLAELLARNGYRTAAFTGGGYISYDFGFGRGFERYSIVDPMRDVGDELRDSVPRPGDRPYNDFVHAARGLDHVLAWIEAHREQPFFLFLHSYLVHDYSAPDELTRDLEQGCTSKLARDLQPFDADVRSARGEALPQTGAPLDAEDVRHFQNYYDATVRAADRHMERLLDVLARSGLMERAIVVLTADHGEEFWEHGGLYHGKTLYEEILRVPLIVSSPGAPRGRTVDEPVSLVDLAPTILGLAGMPADPRMLGRSLASLWRGEGRDDSAVFAEVNCQNQAQRSMIVTSRHKLIESPDQSKMLDCFRNRYAEPLELYDLSVDPGEKVNLARQKPEEMTALRARLEQQREAMRRLRSEYGGEDARTMSPETVDMLERLGYLGGHR